MAGNRSDGARTRERLLAAAAPIFARKGFRATRVAEICAAAGANVAAVNYHFGGKEALYVEAWKHAFSTSLAAHPLAGGVPPGAPADERLAACIRSVMERILDPESLDFDIIHHEMASPTGVLDRAVREAIEPMRRVFSGLVRELLGPAATDEDVRLTVMSIKSQCFAPLMRERRRQGPGRSPPLLPPLAADIGTLAAHVTAFSLAGIRELRRRRERERRRPASARPAVASAGGRRGSKPARRR